MSIQCKCCQSTNVRSIDNQPLFHPSKQDITKGSMNFDNEIYVEFVCDDCNETFTKVFSLVEKS
jgi:hypothetical protein